MLCYLLTLETNLMNLLDLNDPFGISEIAYSDRADTIVGGSNSITFGLDGNDIITSAYDGAFQMVMGGPGNDSYIINSPGTMTIVDNGNSSNDTVQASGIGVSSGTAFFGTIDSRHLVITDTASGQELIIINYQDSGNKIESIQLSNEVFTYDEIINFIKVSENNLGDHSWENAEALYLAPESTSVMNAEIDFYIAESANINAYLDHETVSITSVSSAEYPNDIEVETLLPKPGTSYKWGNEIGTAPTLTYSFSDSSSFYMNDNYYSDFGEYGFDTENFKNLLSTPENELEDFKQLDKEVIAESLKDWGDASGIEFVQVEDTNSLYGEIRFHLLNFDAFHDVNDTFVDAGGFAFFPWPDDEIGGDVFINSLYSPNANDGYYEYLLSHEIGHALGIDHTHDGYIPDDTILNTESLMTYDQNNYYPDSPMAYDIKAVEFIYGGNENANIGDDTYSWDINHYTRSSIIDDRGFDQYDFSNQYNGVFVNLSSDSWSSLSNNQILENDALIYENGQVYTSSGTSIEKLTTTNFQDNVYDNGLVDNIIYLGVDNDNFYYFGGSDQVYGGQGNDYVYLDFVSSDFYATAGPDENSFLIFNDIDQNDYHPLMTLDGIEYIQFTDVLKTPKELIFNEAATLTATVDKWQDDGMGAGMDGPSMKLHYKDIDGIPDEVGIDLISKDGGEAGHKHKPDMDKGNYELRVEHHQETDGAIDIDDVMGVLSLSRGISSVNSKEHELAADWNGDGLIDIDDVMGVLSRSRGLNKDDEWRFHEKTTNTSLWDNDSKTNKLDITLDGDDEIDLSAILRGDVNGSYDATVHNRAPAAAPEPNYAPLPLSHEDQLVNVQFDFV